MKKSIPYLILFLSLSFVSCDGEDIVKGLFWGINKMTGEGFLPSTELLALGQFARTEINISKNTINGKKENTIELRLYNGKSEDVIYNEENTARKCAELYAEGFSKIAEYEIIKILFIQTDPFNPENVAISEYIFQVNDFLE